MTNRQQKITKIVLVFISLFIIYVTFNFNRIKIDGFAVELLSITFGADTHYAVKYSDNNFLKIKIGMTEQNVYSLIGKPLSKYPAKRLDLNPIDTTRFVGLSYSESPSGDDYRERAIELDNGIVVKVIGELYVD